MSGTLLRPLRSQAIGTTPVILGGYTAATHTVGTVVSALTIANVLNGPTIVATVVIKNGATVTNWVLNAVVMQGGCLVLADENVRHALANGDQIVISCNIASGVDAIGTIAEIDA